MPSPGATTVSIPAPRDRHDALLRERVAPVVRELAALPGIDAVYFERVNKPDWGLRVRVLSDGPETDEAAQALLQARFDAMAQPFVFVNDDAEDKWVGGPDEEQFLKRLHHLDSQACLDLLDLDARAGLRTSRAQWSLLVVERLLDLFGVSGVERLNFYRRGFSWAPSLGRWDAEVFAALERKFTAQAAALRAAIDLCAGDDAPVAWGGAAGAHIAAHLLDAARGPVNTVLAAHEGGLLAKTPTDMALFVSHAHANRLGIHATQEGTMRYLVFRARGGEGPQAL